MNLRSLLVGAVALTSTNAFLIPLEISNQVEKAETELESLWANQARTIQLSCSSCRYSDSEKAPAESMDEMNEAIIVSTQAPLW